MTFDLHQKVSVPDDVLIRVLHDEAVILNLDSGTYLGLNEAGTRMWTLLTESSSIQAAFEALLNEYDVEAKQLRADLIDLIAQLIDNGLLVLLYDDI